MRPFLFMVMVWEPYDGLHTYKPTTCLDFGRQNMVAMEAVLNQVP